MQRKSGCNNEGLSTSYCGQGADLKVAKTTSWWQISKWIHNKHADYWSRFSELKHRKSFIKRPSKDTKENSLKKVENGRAANGAQYPKMISKQERIKTQTAKCVVMKKKTAQ